MRTTVIWSFLSLVALATGGLVSGCDSDAKIAKSAAGESCDKTSDCNDGLKCLEGTCYKTTSHPSTGGSANNEGGEGNGTAGTVVVGPKPPVLGGEGESCTRRADCEDGLACLSQRCQKGADMGMGGEGNTPGPVLGGPGETCGLTSDCGPGMACLPNGIAPAPVDTLAIGSNSVGVCTLLDSGLTPSGKTCGHECIEAADCCELPLAQQTATGASSCSDLADLVAGVPSCATAVGVNGVICLAYSAYCDDQCGKKGPWTCEAGACHYTAKCTKATQVVGGCPAYTRGGTAIPACDTKTSKCAAAEVVGCTTDAKCLDAVVADHATDTCTADECVCDKPSGGCYRKCSENTDCENGYNCDDATSLCVPIGACSGDLQCIQQSHDIRAKCTDGACHVPCEHDIDCSPGGLNGAFYAVCGEDKTCQALGCNSDDECTGQPLEGGLHSFCDMPSAGAATTAPHSAITD